jgi:hypothetical protein
VSSVILDVAHRIYNARRERVAIPISAISMVEIADLVVRTDNPDAVRVQAGAVRARTETVTSVDRLAGAEFAAMKTQMVVRAVVRRIFKLAASETGKSLTRPKPADEDKESDVETQAGGGKRVARGGEAERRKKEEEERRRRELEQINSLAWDLVALLWVALEDADTRCWALLPASFQVTRLELAEGEHDVVVQADWRGQPVGTAQTVRVRVRPGRTTFVIAQVPSCQGGPPPLTTAPAAAGAQ